MLVTQQPVLKRFWYPVMPISLLQEGPQSFTLLGQPLVLWLDEEGKPAAVEDRCCHRSAQLSKGIVCDGHIRCPYHGWEFNGSGACVKVPQLTEDFIKFSGWRPALCTKCECREESPPPCRFAQGKSGRVRVTA